MSLDNKDKSEMSEALSKTRQVYWNGGPSPKSMVIPVVLEGKPLEAILDSGAQAAVLNEKIAENLLSQHESLSASLIGVGDKEVPAKFFPKVEITIGGVSYRGPMYTAAMKDDMLLGIDFMTQFDMKIDFSRCEIHVADQVIKAKYVMGAEGEQVTIARVTLASKVNIPAHSPVFAIGRLDKRLEHSHFGFDPCRTAADCMFPSTFHEKGKFAILGFYNDTDSAIQIEADTLVGTAMGADLMSGPKPKKRGARLVRAMKAKKEAAKLPIHLVDLYEHSSKGLSIDEATELRLLLIEYADVFAAHELDLGCFTALKHPIHLLPGSVPFKDRLRRAPIAAEGEEEKNLKAMLDAGVIQPSNSPFSSATVLIRKKDGTVRWCLDYRRLNAMTVKDSHSLPLISDCIDSLSGSKYLSSLDMASGYWQIEVEPEDREKTAFITRWGLFEHVRMPFGLCNAPSTFQRAMNLVLRGMTWKTVLAFLDDVLVMGKDFSEHMTNLRDVLDRFREHNLKLKPRKCSLFQTEVKFLGRIVTGDSVSVDPASQEAVKSWPTPKRTRDVESFLGFVNYNREHMPGMAELAAPLYELTGKAPFVWEERHQEAFQKLKDALVSAHVLALPRKEGTFILDTDSSKIAVGGQLSQIQDGVEKPISFASKSMKPEQRRYCTTRQELLALVTFVRQFRHYLYGRPFLVRTDHSSLAWLMNFKGPNGQLARWLEELQQYNMHIVHRRGREHINADSLSRIPDSLEYCDCYKSGIDLLELPCGGCPFCQRMHRAWHDFDENVDDVVPLSAPIIRVVRIVRLNDSNWADCLTSEGRAKEQDQDSDLKTVKQWLEGQTTPTQEELMASSPEVKILWANRTQLIIKEGVLMYIWKDDTDRELYVVPRQTRDLILKLGHNCSLSGHFGIKKTQDRLRRYFYWPNMSSQVERHIRGCFACNRSKHLRRRYRASLQEFTAGAPMEKVHIDILGPLPETKNRNKYVLLMICQFSKWIEGVALPDQKAKTIARAMVNHFFARLGCPQEIVSDQGSNFCSDLFHDLCQRLGIDKKRTTAFRPSANGQVERMNRSLLQMIRCHLVETFSKQDEWDEVLQLHLGAIRCTENRSTGYTPNLAMLGREVRQPLELMTGVPCETASIHEYVQKTEERLREIHQAIRAALKEQQRRQKRDYEFRVFTARYEIGDAVFLANSAAKVGQCRKLASLWNGPFLVTKVISEILYEVSSAKKKMVVHHDRMRKCTDTSLPLWLTRKREKLEMGRMDDFESESRDMFGMDLNFTLGSFIDEPLYCLCRKPWDGRFMIGCDYCDEWYHGRCVKVTKAQADKIGLYKCPECVKKAH